MKEAVSKEISGITYSVTPLGVTQGIKVLNRITRVLAGAAKGDNVIAGALDALREEDVLFLCDTFKVLTLVEIERGSGKLVPLREIFELHFQAEFGALLEWLQFCLEVNFESLFTKAGELGKKLTTPAQTPSGS